MWEQQHKSGIVHGVYKKYPYQLSCTNLQHTILILFIYLYISLSV